MHADPAAGLYVRLFAGNSSMALSGTHNLVVNGAESDAWRVLPGDTISTIEGPKHVDRITVALEDGMHHIMVPSGTYYADDVEASDFVDLNIPRATWRLWRAYATFRNRIGAPMHGYMVDCYKLGQCALDINFFAHSLNRLTGIDAWGLTSPQPLIHAALFSALIGELADAAKAGISAVSARAVPAWTQTLMASITA